MLYDSSDEEYEFHIFPAATEEDESSDYHFPHVDSIRGSVKLTYQTSDSMEVPNAPELERKFSPQRPKGLANISLGLDPEKQAMREELTRLKCAAGLLPNEATSPSYSDSEESTAYWEEHHERRLRTAQARARKPNLRVHFPESPNLVTGRQSPPAWYLQRELGPETPPSLITPDLPESDSEEEPVPEEPYVPKSSFTKDVHLLYRLESDSDETPDMYYQSSESSIEEYDMANLSFTKIPDSHDVNKPRLKQLTKGIKNRSREDMDDIARAMIVHVDSDDESHDERDQMREMIRQMSSEAEHAKEKSDMEEMMKKISTGEIERPEHCVPSANAWAVVTNEENEGNDQGSSIFSGHIIVDSSDEETTDDEENRAYIAEQLRKQAEREKAVQRNLDDAELGGGPIVYYDDSDEEESSSDQEYVRQQLARLAKQNAQQNEENASSSEDEDEYSEMGHRVSAYSL